MCAGHLCRITTHAGGHQCRIASQRTEVIGSGSQRSGVPLLSLPDCRSNRFWASASGFQWQVAQRIASCAHSKEIAVIDVASQHNTCVQVIYVASQHMPEVIYVASHHNTCHRRSRRIVCHMKYNHNITWSTNRSHHICCSTIVSHFTTHE